MPQPLRQHHPLIILPYQVHALDNVHLMYHDSQLEDNLLGDNLQGGIHLVEDMVMVGIHCVEGTQLAGIHHVEDIRRGDNLEGDKDILEEDTRHGHGNERTAQQQFQQN